MGDSPLPVRPVRTSRMTDPTFYAGCRMPSDHNITNQDVAREMDARIGSERLLAAIQRYFEKGGRG